jgi:tripartite-type tricarboxylate transporter receptor subunit TctC
LRILSDHLSKKWGHPVVVDNRPGGNGFIAVAAFKQGSLDGYDLIELDSSHITTHPHVFRSLPYNVATDFTPLAMILRTWFFVAVAADSPYKTIDDIVVAAKAAPGKINYGSWFIGSPGHLGALRLQEMTGTQMTHVPYRDFGQLYTAVSNKELDWALGSAASAPAAWNAPVRSVSSLLPHPHATSFIRTSHARLNRRHFAALRFKAGSVCSRPGPPLRPFVSASPPTLQKRSSHKQSVNATLH